MGVATATAIVGVGVSVYKTIDEAKKKKAAAKALKDLEQPELKNSAENLQVSTLGSDLQREENARLASTQTEALKESGTRGVIGGSGLVEARNQKLNRDLASGLDQQQKDIDKMKATDDVNIRQVAEQRHIADVSALSSQYNAAAQAQNTAMGNAITSAGTAANAYNNSRVPKDEDNTDETSSNYKSKYKAKDGDRRDTRFNY
jgi:hypothetical protein